MAATRSHSQTNQQGPRADGTLCIDLILPGRVEDIGHGGRVKRVARAIVCGHRQKLAIPSGICLELAIDRVGVELVKMILHRILVPDFIPNVGSISQNIQGDHSGSS